MAEWHKDSKQNFGKESLKVNWHFRWSVRRKEFAPNASCYDMIPCYFTNVDRDWMSSVSAIVLLMTDVGYQPLAQPNLEGQVITISSTYQKYKTPADIAHWVMDTKTIPPQ